MTLNSKNLLLGLAVVSALSSVSANADGGSCHRQDRICDIEVADIILDLKRAEIHGDDGGVELVSVTGLIGVQALVESGLKITPTSEPKRRIRTIDLVIDEEDDGFILDSAGNMHPLILTHSQQNHGFKIRLEAKVDLDANQSYRLKLTEFPKLKKFGDFGCRLNNNLPGTLTSEGSNPPPPPPPPGNDP